MSLNTIFGVLVIGIEKDILLMLYFIFSLMDKLRCTIKYVLVFVIVLSTCIVFTSCANISRNISCSLNGIILSLDSYPTFVLDEATSSMNQKQLEEKNATISSLNKAIDDRPDLADMLSADMIDGDSNDYVYEGGESFFKVVGEFADENYSKARSMFPEITCDEFYYHTAYAYAVCNHNPELFEIPYIEFMRNSDVKTFTPTFDQLMSSAFWTSYCSERFGFDYYDDNTSFDGTFDCEDLDCETTFELAMMLNMAVKKSVMRGDIEIGEFARKSNKILSHHVSTQIRTELKEHGMNHVSIDDNDYFAQMGNVGTYLHSRIESLKISTSTILLGHLGISIMNYSYMFYTGSANYSDFIASELCRLITSGASSKPAWEEQGWHVGAWAIERSIFE